MDPVALQAKFDQINACHRDSVAALTEVNATLPRLPYSEQRQFARKLHPIMREFLQGRAEEEGLYYLAHVLKENT